MPQRFEIYIVYKRHYINALPFLIYLLTVESKCIRWLYADKEDRRIDRQTDGRTDSRPLHYAFRETWPAW